MTAMMRLSFLVVALAAISAAYPQHHYRFRQVADETTTVQAPWSTSDATSWETTEGPTEQPSTERPTEQPSTDGTTEQPSTEQPSTEGTPEAPSSSEPPTEASTTREPTTEAPTTPESTTETSTTSEPTTEAPTTITEAPTTPESTTETSTTPEPTSEAPTTTTEAPTTTTEAPTTTTEAPTTTTEAPTTTTEAPTTTTEATTTTTETPTTTPIPCDPSSIDIYALVAAIQNHIQNIGLDPFVVPDITELPFVFHYLLTNHRATLDLTEGWATDLSTLLLAGPANVTCSSDASLHVSIPLLFEDITISWSYQISAGLFSPGGDMNVINRFVEAAVTLISDPASTDLRFQSLEIINQGIPDITYTSLGAIANAVAEPLDTLYRETIFPQFIQEVRNKLLQ